VLPKQPKTLSPGSVFAFLQTKPSKIRDGEVRKRLAQYYKKSATAPIEIELPIGSYVPHFHYRKPEPVQPPVEAAPHLPLPTDAPHTPYRLLAARAKYLIAVAAVCLVAVGILLPMNSHKDAVRGVWAPILNRSIPVDICTGSPPPDDADVADDAANVSIEQHFLRSGYRISIPTAAAIADISGFLTNSFILATCVGASLHSLAHCPCYKLRINSGITLNYYLETSLVLIRQQVAQRIRTSLRNDK
jgi:hypothetical protein